MQEVEEESSPPGLSAESALALLGSAMVRGHQIQIANKKLYCQFYHF